MAATVEALSGMPGLRCGPVEPSHPGAGTRRPQPRTQVAPLAPEMLALVAGALVLGIVAVATLLLAGDPLGAGAMWLDEALTANIAGLPPSEMLDALRSDGHPPAYYLLLHVWMGVVGEGDAAIRSLSAVLWLATLPLMWVAGRRIGGQPVAWVAAGMWALSPLAVRYATENRMYSMVALLVMAAWLLIDDLALGWDRGRDRGRGLWWRVPALALVTGLLTLTHYWGLFAVAVAGLVALVCALWGRRREAWWIVAGLAGGGLLFAVWLPSFLDQLATTATPWAQAPRPGVAVGIFLLDLSGAPPAEAVLVGAMSLVIVLLALMVRRSVGSTIEIDVRTVPGIRIEAIVVAGVLAVGTAAAVVADTAVVSRYAMVVVPLVVLVLALGAVVVAHRGVRFVLLAIVLAGGVVSVADQATTQRTQMTEIASEVSGVVSEGDVVAYCPDQLGPAGSRAFAAQGGLVDVQQLVIPSLGAPEFVDWRDYAERNEAADSEAIADAISERAGPSGSVFVVWNPSYRTYEGLCEAVVAGLTARFGSVVALVQADGDNAFEHANVTWFRR